MSVSEETREAILNDWSQGLRTGPIAQARRVTRNVVVGIVFRARSAGDPRAAARAPTLGGRARASKPKNAGIGAPDKPKAKSQKLKGRAKVRPASPVAVVQAPAKRAPVINASPEQLAEMRAEIAVEAQVLDQVGEGRSATAFFDVRANQCRFPLWSGRVDVATAMFCGEPTVSESCSWCAAHLAAVSAKPRGSLSDRAIKQAMRTGA